MGGLLFEVLQDVVGRVEAACITLRLVQSSFDHGFGYVLNQDETRQGLNPRIRISLIETLALENQTFVLGLWTSMASEHQA